ncbi:MAG: four helix bundle protein [Patescibacteria group bacterium]
MPVVEKLTNAYKLWQECHRLFPKETKYTLGEKVDELLVESIESALTAAFLPPEQKRPFVHRAMVKRDTAEVMLRIAWELNCIDTKKYAALSMPLAEAGQQLGGWHNQLVKQNSPQRCGEK